MFNTMNDHKAGCFVCGKDLVYTKENENLTCIYCENTFSTNTRCEQGHYICDSCHSSSANDIIEQYCLSCLSENPFDIATTLMKHPSIKMHGPEHHFLVPAVLLTAFYNREENPSKKQETLKQARQRSKAVPGGSCGFNGACGAAIGTGIFMSLITGATPLSKEEWGLSNKITAKSLMSIAACGGPRCCKRDTFLSIGTVVKHFGWDINKRLHCDFSELNKECLKKRCPYYSNDKFCRLDQTNTKRL